MPTKAIRGASLLAAAATGVLAVVLAVVPAAGVTAGAGSAARPKAPVLQTVHGGGHGSYLRWSGTSTSGYRVEQSTVADFASGVRTYTTHGAGRTLTPYGLSVGRRYYFRVAALGGGRASAWSATRRSARVTAAEAPLRVMTYNTLSATFDGTRDNGGTIAPFAKRRPGQVALIEQADPDVLGVDEGSACLVKAPPGGHCTREVDEDLAGIDSGSRRWVMSAAGDKAATYFNSGDYILYQPSAVTPIGDGGYWLYLGDDKQDRAAAYQLFQTKAGGARFLFVATHLVADKGAGYDADRKAETVDMVTRARRYASEHGDVPILFTGDFNSWPDRYQVVDTPGNYLRGQGIPDSFEVAQRRQNPQYETINQYFRTPPLGGDADHVFATPGVGVEDWHQLLRLKNGKFVGTIPSDHNPVYVDLELPR